MTDKKKKVVRDIQDRTGWKYQFCLFIVTQLGYEYVSKAVDDLEDKKETKEQLSNRLNKEAKTAQKQEKKEMAFVDGAESVGMGSGDGSGIKKAP